MFARLVLSVVQLLVGLSIASYAVMHLQNYIPLQGPVDLFMLAVVYAAVVWIIGLIGFWILHDVGQPTLSSFASALIFACALASLTLFPDAVMALNRVIPIPLTVYPLIGAVVGYAISR